MKTEKPVRVVPCRGKHKTEVRIFAREIHESFCVQPGCKFQGQPSQQGVCHTTKTFAGAADWKYIDQLIGAGDKFLSEARAIYRRRYRGKPRAYIEHLESHLACTWSNMVCNLDELIRLRREVALLRKRLAKQVAR